MNITDVLDFLDNFNIVRPGSYDVPNRVLTDSLVEYNASKSIEPLMCYEKVLFARWSDPFASYGVYIPKEDINFLLSFIDGKEYYKLDDLIDVNEQFSFKRKVIFCKEYYENEKTYKRRRKVASAKITNKKLREKIFQRDGYACKSCGISESLSIDHIIPVLKGGDNKESNLQTLCTTCNSKKGAKYDI